MAFVVILNNFNLVYFTTALDLLNTQVNQYHSNRESLTGFPSYSFFD